MPTYVYRPEHPLCDEDGFVDKSNLYSFDDKTMLRGNQKVKIHTISDNMEYTRHMADGKYYSSKHKFREATKRAGCIEVGNEVKTLLKPKPFYMPDRKQRREDIKKSIYHLRNGT